MKKVFKWNEGNRSSTATPWFIKLQACFPCFPAMLCPYFQKCPCNSRAWWRVQQTIVMNVGQINKSLKTQSLALISKARGHRRRIHQLRQGASQLGHDIPGWSFQGGICKVRRACLDLADTASIISPQAREAARRREVAGRLERQLKEERRANWMASLQGPGSARGGRCHTML